MFNVVHGKLREVILMSGPALGAVATVSAVLARFPDSRAWSVGWVIAALALGGYFALMLLYVLSPLIVAALQRRAKMKTPQPSLFSWQVVGSIVSEDAEIRAIVRFRYLGTLDFGKFTVHFGVDEVGANGLLFGCNASVIATPGSDKPPRHGEDLDFAIRFRKPKAGRFALYVNSIHYAGRAILSEDQSFQVPGDQRDYWMEP